jgi:hypothetical protein
MPHAKDVNLPHGRLGRILAASRIVKIKEVYPNVVDGM